MSVGGPVTDRKSNSAKEMKLGSFAVWCHETSKVSSEGLIFCLASGWFEQLGVRSFNVKALPKTLNELKWHCSPLLVLGNKHRWLWPVTEAVAKTTSAEMLLNGKLLQYSPAAGPGLSKSEVSRALLQYSYTTFVHLMGSMKSEVTGEPGLRVSFQTYGVLNRTMSILLRSAF